MLSTLLCTALSIHLVSPTSNASRAPPPGSRCKKRVQPSEAVQARETEEYFSNICPHFLRQVPPSVQGVLQNRYIDGILCTWHQAGGPDVPRKAFRNGLAGDMQHL